MNTLTATLSQTAIRRGKDVASVWVQIDVAAPKVAALTDAKRAALDLILVIDHSGSMMGEKLENAKTAAQQVLQQLSGDDRSCIIGYDSHVSVKAGLSSDHQHSARQVANIRAGSATALAPALYQAFEQAGGEQANRQRHVFLLSDGLANVGDRDPNIIADKIKQYAGIRVSTFGLGYDYDEVLMERVATAGGGGYYFLSSANDAPAAFAGELDQVMQVSIRNARLNIHPSSKHVTIKSVHGLDAHDHTDIHVGDIAAGAVRTVLVELEVAADTLAKTRKLLSVDLQGQQLQDDGSLKQISVSQTCTVKVADSDEQVAESVNGAIMARAVEYKAAEAQRQAADAADGGDFDMAFALLSEAQQESESVLAFVDDERLLTKSRQLQMHANIMAAPASYDSRAAKDVRFESYRTRSSRS